MNFEDLKNPELQEKLKSAQSPEDILAIAKEEGFELTDDQRHLWPKGQVHGPKGWLAIWVAEYAAGWRWQMARNEAGRRFGWPNTRPCCFSA